MMLKFRSLLSFYILIISMVSNASDTIIVGGDYNYPPYSFLDKDGNEIGYDVDVIKAIAKQIDLVVEFKFDHWDTTLSSLKQGEIDVIASIVYSESREENYDFTFPLHTEYYAIFAHNKTLINDVYDLESKRSAYLKGDISNEKFLQPMGLLANLVQVNSLPEAFSKINNHKCDYVIAPYPLGMQIIDEGGFSNIKVKGPPVIPSVYCLAVSEGNSKLLSQLNLGIERLNRSGQLNSIYNKWITYKRVEDRYQSWFTYTIYILAGLAGVVVVLFLFWNSLRIQVRKKTTQIRNTEELYRKVFKAVDEAILVGTVDGTITDLNAKARELYKDYKGEIVGKSIFDIAEEGNLVFAEQVLDKLKKGEETVFGELRKQNSKGEFFFKVVGECIQYDNENRFLVVFHDITEEKKSINKLIEAKRIADEANNAKSSFLASVSHEVRTPLNAIIGYSNLLAKSKLSSSQIDYNQKIIMSAELLLGLVNNVLDIAKIEAKKFTLHNEAFSLPKVIRKITEIQQFKVAEKGLTFNVDINEHIPEWVIGDELRLTQVLLNVLSNAVKFTDKGSVILKTNFENLNNQNIKNILFSIKDTGIGISPDKIEEVFKPFEQADNTTSRMYSGTGLGLSITKHLVALMNGEICIESDLNKGTIVNISIPLKQASDSRVLPDESESNPKNEVELNDIRILLVEDNEFNAEILLEQLSEVDVSVIHANSGFKALELLQVNSFDVILMDIEMPGMDGFETTRKIKSMNLSNAPIIALSAHTMQADIERTKAAGMAEHLSKPIEIDKVVDTIYNAIHEKESLFLNIDEATQLFGGDIEMYSSVLARFVNTYRDIPNDIMHLYNTDKSKLLTVLHNLKSALKTIGGDTLSYEAAEMEQVYRNNNVVKQEKLQEFALKLKQLITEANKTI